MAIMLSPLGLIEASAAEYPAKPVRIITQGAAGSGPDVLARIVADHLSRLWGQQALIVNHPGGGGIIAARAVAAAEPDGYNLYLATSTTFIIMPEVNKKLPLDLKRDVTPIGLIGQTPMMIAVNPKLGVNSLAEFVSLTKRQPGQTFYAANNRGSTPHLVGELFRIRTGADITFIPYPGAAAGLRDVVGGRVAMMVESVGALAGAVQGGSVNALAVAAKQRVPTFPEVPTVSETMPGFLSPGFMVLMAPSGTPEAIVRKVNRDLNTVLGYPALKQRFQELGAVVRTLSPAETAEYIDGEVQTWRPVVRQVGLAAQ
jgi:tripartite-type tricarboxylate transporter receptor subunit TctC